MVKDKVIVGTGGGDGGGGGYGIRGVIAAFDAVTGRQAWRFHTIPGPGEPGHESWSGESWKTGGAGVWQVGAYAPELNLTYWGVGNPGLDDGTNRLGDNLYSDSVVALDADAGTLKWYYQFTPHDVMDWDAAHVPPLTDLMWFGTEAGRVNEAGDRALRHPGDPIVQTALTWTSSPQNVRKSHGSVRLYRGSAQLPLRMTVVLLAQEGSRRIPRILLAIRR